MTKNEPEITWTLPLEKANVVLMLIGKQPFEQVADLIMDLRNQAQAQLQSFQQQQAGGFEQPALQRSNGEART